MLPQPSSALIPAVRVTESSVHQNGQNGQRRMTQPESAGFLCVNREIEDAGAA